MSQNQTQDIRIQQKVDTKTNWESNNPILLDKEIGYERETGKYKIGDGKASWNGLAYASIADVGLSEYSNTFGQDNIAGCKCYWWHSIDFDNKTIILQQEQARLTEGETLEPFEIGYVAGDVISIVSDAKYYNCGTIASVEDNVITLKEALPFTTAKDNANDMGFDDCAVWCVAKPEVGTGDIGLGAHAEGVSTKALNCGAHAEGRQTEVQGHYGHAEGRKTKAYGVAAHSEGQETTGSGSYAHAEGQATTASGIRAHSEGYKTKATGANAHTEGHTTIASGNEAHSEGQGTKATGSTAHAENYYTTASGDKSHAEGSSTTAAGTAAHAEGSASKANGEASHAEGSSTTEGKYSHAEGYQNIAYGEAQHVQGKWAKEDTAGKYAHIVGNGTGYNTGRSNAHTLDWEGNAWYAGAVYSGQNISADTKLITVAELTAAINDAILASWEVPV